jgi:hypothetical protein
MRRGIIDEIAQTKQSFYHWRCAGKLINGKASQPKAMFVWHSSGPGNPEWIWSRQWGIWLAELLQIKK